MDNTRSKAMLWWQWLTIYEKEAALDNLSFFILGGDVREPHTLSGSEIETLFIYSLKCAESDETTN